MRYKKAQLNDIPIDLKNILMSILIPKEDRHRGLFTKGLFLYGSTGRGKTHTMYAITNVMRSSGDDFEIYSWVEALSTIKQNFNKSSEYTPHPFESPNFSKLKAIFLDDVGVEKDSEWSQEMLYIIINKAYTQGVPVFISTNLNIKEFGIRYGERILARLEETAIFYELKGVDHRIQK